MRRVAQTNGGGVAEYYTADDSATEPDTEPDVIPAGKLNPTIEGTSQLAELSECYNGFAAPRNHSRALTESDSATESDSDTDVLPLTVKISPFCRFLPTTRLVIEPQAGIPSG